MTGTSPRDRGSAWGRRALALLVVALTGLVATSSSLHRASASLHQVVRPPAVPSQAGYAGHPHSATTAGKPASLADATLQLQALLGHHSVLAADMMHARIDGNELLADAIETALDKNTDAVGQLFASVLGDQAAGQFKLLWAAHVMALSNYSRGVGGHDSGARDSARAALTAFERNLAGFLSGASHGRLRPDAAQAAAYMHVNHLLQGADAYGSGDYVEAARLYREAYAQTFALGETLAGALLGPAKTSFLKSPAWRLRSQLTKVLGEHVVLVVAATRAGVDNKPDFTAAAAAVNANTRDLAGAVDTLFGAAAARRFQALWADHIDQVMRYTAGIASGDAMRREDAVNQLSSFENSLATFLDTATAGRLPSESLAQAVLMHDRMLLAQIDAFGAKQYAQAEDSAYSTYEHMVGVADLLATAFARTLGSRLPHGGSQTGLGGTAGEHDHETS